MYIYICIYVLYAYTKPCIALTAILSSKTVAEAARNLSYFVRTGIEKLTCDLNNMCFMVEVYVFFVFLRLGLWGIYTL